MREDESLEVAGEIPFDPRRPILGCFEPLYAIGRDRARASASGGERSRAGAGQSEASVARLPVRSVTGRRAPPRESLLGPHRLAV